jgi:diadenosine tetraphosphatase ApaH/serine/threonine PP2A family protein phosphatase
MYTAVIGDIHGNIEALTAVLRTLSSLGIQRIFCTGDIVGYGASPRQCVELVRDLGIPSVRGNHDDYTTHEDGGRWHIRPEAKEVILWNRSQLSKDLIDWLRALPYVRQEQGFTMVHASHVYTPQWPYILNERTAIQNFLFQPGNLSFCGHSHVPVYIAHRAGRRPSLDILRNVILPRRQRVTIGVGAVGQPRDNDPRACVVLYDTQVRSVRVLRVPYDVEAAKLRIRRAGLPEDLAVRLALGQ